MRRIALPLLAASLAAAGAAFAQPPGGRDGYDAPSYPQAAPSAGPDRNGYDQGYDEDDRAPAPGAVSAEGAPDYGAQGYGAQGYAGAGQGAPDLARDLGLSADQRGALQAYQAATTPTAAEQARMEADQRALAGMTTPQRLDAIGAQMRRDDADFARRADAVRRFYSQLSPAQQRRFDQLTGPGSEAQGGGPAGYGDGQGGGAPPR